MISLWSQKIQSSTTHIHKKHKLDVAHELDIVVHDATRRLVYFSSMSTHLSWFCKSHYSNVQNKQQEQHLPVQQPQLADKK